MHGIIQSGKLVVVGVSYPGAKPIAYEDVPIFDQSTQYVVQQDPVDVGDHIFMGVEIHDLPPQDDPNMPL